MNKKRILSCFMSSLILISGAFSAAPKTISDFSVSAEEMVSEYDNDFLYYIYEDHVEISRYFSEKNIIEIPSEYKGLPVTSINHFSSDDYLEEIIIPDTVTEIKDKAFINCTNLSKVTLSKSLETIGESAFSNTGITEIMIPESVSFIGDECFSSSALENIFVSENNPNYKHIDGVLFSKDGATLISYPSKKSETIYTIPDGTKTIYNSAFAWNSTIEEIYMPDSVEYVDDFAFYWCTNLKVAILSDNITEIGSHAFSYCESMEICPLPSSLKIINRNAFDSCTSLTHLIFPDTLEIIEDSAFNYCISLRNTVLPESVKYIGYDAFGSVFGKIAVLNPNCEINMEQGTFGYAAVYGLPGSTAEAYAEQFYSTAFDTMDNWKDISGQCGENAYYTIDYLGNLKITGSGDLYDCEFYVDEDNETYIISPFYEYRYYVSSIEIENGITGIGDLDFWEFINLKSVVLPESVNSIGLSGFYACVKLNEIVINNPECLIYDDETSLPEQTVIYGYKDSNAEAYANKYNRVFKAIDEYNPDYSLSDLITLKKNLLKIISLTEKQYEKYDMNSDGKVNVFDFVLLKRELM